jgi:hypothetical protein
MPQFLEAVWQLRESDLRKLVTLGDTLNVWQT